RRKLTVYRESGAVSAPSGLNAGSIGGAANTEGRPDLLKLAIASLEDDQASEIITIDLTGKSALADHMIVASGRSSRHVNAIVDKLVERLKREGKVIPRLEGVEHGDWALIDAGDIIVHIFRPEVREFYNLERMWMPEGDGPASPQPS
ncbi:UNVERIFIED_CONTAM: hypothetical protein GTU68_022515, partial [Idotea baltica]|nr:hypothetical protein [Idotea baltica]